MLPSHAKKGNYNQSKDKALCFAHSVKGRAQCKGRPFQVSTSWLHCVSLAADVSLLPAKPPLNRFAVLRSQPTSRFLQQLPKHFPRIDLLGRWSNSSDCCFAAFLTAYRVRLSRRLITIVCRSDCCSLITTLGS